MRVLMLNGLLNFDFGCMKELLCILAKDHCKGLFSVNFGELPEVGLEGWQLLHRRLPATGIRYLVRPHPPMPIARHAP